MLGHLRAAREGARHLRHNPLATLVGMLVMAVAIGLPATLYALIALQQELVGGWGEQATVSMFLEREAGAPQAEEVAATVGKWREIDAVRQITPDEAYAEFARAMGFEDTAPASASPLPFVLVVTPAAAVWERGEGEALVRRLSAIDGVDDVVADLDWVAKLEALGRLSRRMVWVLAVVLLGAAVLVVGNTVRVLVQQQIVEIEVLKLVGATDAYVRRPFLYGGALHGLGAGVLAVFLLLAVFLALAGPVGAVADAYLGGGGLSPPPPGFLAAVVAAAGVAGWSGAWVGTARSLRQFEPGAAQSD
ncbi:MAG: cell division protein FtsX [Gammaproteobacteria bacterium]